MSLIRFRSWFMRQFGPFSPGRRTTLPGHRFRPEVLPLEDRVVPSVTTINEVEPNDLPDQGTMIPNVAVGSAVGTAVALGKGDNVGEVDYYRFWAYPGQRLWAYVDTGGPATGNSRDSVLTLLDPDKNPIEADNNDGTGNGGDNTVETVDASVIAGRTLTAAVPGFQTYYLKVQTVGATVLNAYKLNVRVTTEFFAQTDFEPNDTFQTASRIADFDAAAARSGSIASVGDVDWYNFFARAGDHVFIALDANPDRNGSGPDLALDYYGTAPAAPQPLLTADSSAASTPTNSAAEGFSYDVTATGTHYLRVRSNAGTGGYELLVAGNSHPGGFLFSQAAVTVSEADGGAMLTVQRSFGADGAASVQYAVTGGTATPGSDYTPVGGTLTFANGETSKKIFLPIRADAFKEGSETITLTLSQPSDGALLVFPNVATVTIVDSAAPPVADVTPLVTAVPGKLRHRGRRYRQLVTLRLQGGQGLYGPLALVLDGLHNARLSRSDGVAAAHASPGSPFVFVTPGSDNVLDPGEVLTVMLAFTGRRRPVYVPHVLAGSGVY